MAYAAITSEWDIGLLLPCNVVVYEKENMIWIGVMKPTAAMASAENKTLGELAIDVEAKLKRAFDNI